MHIMLFGPAGSGKGTQAQLLAKRWNLQHLSTGDMLREEVALKTEFGVSYEALLAKGELASDEFVTALVKKRLESPRGTRGAIFDGYPRTVEQAKSLDALLAARGEKIMLIVEFLANPRTLLARVLKRATDGSGRSDDTKDTFLKRMRVYEENARPIIFYYSARNAVRLRLNAARPIAKVNAEINEAIGVLLEDLQASGEK